MSERILLTGASRGIGVAIAEALARRGAHLVLTARSQQGLDATARRVEAAGGTVTVLPCDLGVAAERDALVQAAWADGPLTGLVNNAGVEVPMAVLDQQPEQIAQQIAVNLVAPIQLTRLVVARMVEQQRGSVAMVSSMSGKAPTPYNAIYTATKFGLNGFTASLRVELEGTGVHAGVVCPSFVGEAGMSHDLGVVPPRWVPPVSLDRVVKGTLEVLDGRSEVLVTTPLARPLLALTQLMPSLDRTVLGALGVLDVLKERAHRTAEQQRRLGRYRGT